MATVISDPRMVRSRSGLHSALLELLSEKQFDAITVREICQRSKVSYATFFRHYESKEALLHDLAADQIARLLDMCVPVLFVANSRESTRALCAYVDQRRTLWQGLLTGGAAAIVREEFIGQARQLAERYPGGGSWLPKDLAVTWSTGSVIDLLAWWLAQEKPCGIDEVAMIIDRLVITPTLSAT